MLILALTVGVMSLTKMPVVTADLAVSIQQSRTQRPPMVDVI